VLTGPFSPLFGPFFRAKRAGPARLGPLRAGLEQKLKLAGTAGPARFWPGFTGPGPGRPVWPSLRTFLARCDLHARDACLILILPPVYYQLQLACSMASGRAPARRRGSRCRLVRPPRAPHARHRAELPPNPGAAAAADRRRISPRALN
jgi:hypothetical protein